MAWAVITLVGNKASWDKLSSPFCAYQIHLARGSSYRKVRRQADSRPDRQLLNHYCSVASWLIVWSLLMIIIRFFEDTKTLWWGLLPPITVEERDVSPIMISKSLLKFKLLKKELFGWLLILCVCCLYADIVAVISNYKFHRTKEYSQLFYSHLKSGPSVIRTVLWTS